MRALSQQTPLLIRSKVLSEASVVSSAARYSPHARRHMLRADALRHIIYGASSRRCSDQSMSVTAKEQVVQHAF